MAKENILDIFMWIAGLIVALAVGFALISGTLTVPFLPVIVMQVVGWTVIVATGIGFIAKLVSWFS